MAYSARIHWRVIRVSPKNPRARYVDAACPSTSRSRSLKTTTDPKLVTCKKCRRALGI